MDVKEAVVLIISDQLGIEPKSNFLDKTIVQLGGDSLEAVEIIMFMEEAFDIEISDDDGLRLMDMSVSKIADFIGPIAKQIDLSDVCLGRFPVTDYDDVIPELEECDLLNEFSFAIENIKNGHRVTRQSWNPSQFIFLVAGSTFAVNRAPLDQMFPIGTKITYQSHIDIKYPDGTVGVWSSTQEDLLANDWLLAD